MSYPSPSPQVCPPRYIRRDQENENPNDGRSSPAATSSVAFEDVELSVDMSKDDLYKVYPDFFHLPSTAHKESSRLPAGCRVKS